jgi:hypothetical protein
MADKPIWVNYKVTWLFLTKLCGSVPADPELMQKWLEARQPRVRPPGGRTIDEIQQEVFTTLATESESEEEQVDQSLLVFQRENGVLVQRAATVRAHMKDCARILSAQYIGKIQGERSFSTKVLNGVYPDERQYWLPILRPEGDPVTDADGRRDKAVHVRGPKGQAMNALKTFEFIQPARIDFTLKVLGGSVKMKDLDTLFRYGGVHGFAGERGDGEGRYTHTIEEIAAE